MRPFSHNQNGGEKVRCQSLNTAFVWEQPRKRPLIRPATADENARRSPPSPPRGRKTQFLRACARNRFSLCPGGEKGGKVSGRYLFPDGHGRLIRSLLSSRRRPIYFPTQYVENVMEHVYNEAHAHQLVLGKAASCRSSAVHLFSGRCDHRGDSSGSIATTRASRTFRCEGVEAL